MSQNHIGLAGNAFANGIARDSAVYIGPREELIIANVKIALTTLDSVILLTGTAGVGKTTIATTALRDTSTRLALGWLSGTPLSANELLELLLIEFGFNPQEIGRVERQQAWRQFLSEMSATESRVFVVVEQAETLGLEALRALGALTAADPNGCPGANVILLGSPELTTLLRTPALAPLRQRVRLSQYLAPFDVHTLGEYLRHRVTDAGGDFGRLFSADAVHMLHRYSGGVARIANNLCETALTLAATQREPQVTAQLVARVATALFDLDPEEAPLDDIPVLTDVVDPAVLAEPRAPALAVTTSTASERNDPLQTAKAG